MFCFFFQKERQEKVVYQLKWCVSISLTVCSFTSKEKSVRESLKKITRSFLKGHLHILVTCYVLFCFYLLFVNCDFGTSLFFDHENGTQYIYSARLFTDM